MRGSSVNIHLHVVDRGVGFDPHRTVSGAGVGLVAIRERLKLVKGEILIISEPGKGTRVETSVPLPSSRESLK
jgi:signal transduction histidine kinase